MKLSFLEAPMASLSKKSKEFIREPMEGKDISKVPGIQKRIGKLLKEKGITTAKKLYEDQFLEKDEDEFKEFLKEHKSDSRNQNYTYDAMKGWHEQHGGIKTKEEEDDDSKKSE